MLICDKVEGEQPEDFGPQIELDLGTWSSIYDLGEPPVEAVEEEHAVEVIGVGRFEEKPDEEMGIGDSPVLALRRVIPCSEITRGMSSKRWETSILRKPHKHPLSLFSLFPRKKTHLVLNRGGRG